jgi:hypothetical protein
MKKTLLALGTAAALTLGAVAAVPTTAGAAPWGWGHGGHFRHFWGGPRFAFGFGAGPWSSYAFAGSCSRVHRIWTPFGWRWRRVWVC